MDYEKKYKNLLAKAKEFEFQGYIDEECLYDMFPELREESEDERIRKAMIDFFKHEREEGITVLHYGVNIERMIAWLKSLRPQNRWKPSDEQMKALADALSLAKNCGEEWVFDIRTLYEQLKKLREE